MRTGLLLLHTLLYTCTFAQPGQWRSVIPDSLQPYANYVFVEDFSRDEFATVYLQKGTDTLHPKLVVGLVDHCGSYINRYSIEGLGFTPLWINNIARDQGGNLYISGLTGSTVPLTGHGHPPFIVKLNPQMKVIWAKSYRTPSDVHYPGLFEINRFNQGSLLFLTDLTNYGNTLLKIDDNGNVQWAKAYEDFGNVLGEISSTNDGGCILHIRGSVSKVNALGKTEWRTELSKGGAISNTVEIDNGFMFFAGVRSGIGRGRVIMLNHNGSLRWASKEFANLKASHAKKLSQNEVLFTGYGTSHHPSAPSNSGICLMRINSSGFIQKMQVLHKPDMAYHSGIDFVSIPSKGDYLVESTVDSTWTSYLHFSKFPPEWDSLVCYDTAPFEEGQNTVVTDSVLPLLNHKDINITVANIPISVQALGTQALTYACQILDKGHTFSLGPDTTLCPGDFLTLQGPAGYRYQWNTGSTERSITISEAGWYALEASFGCDTIVYRDSIFVDYFPGQDLSILLNQNSIFTGDSLNIQGLGGNPGKYTWYLNGQAVEAGSQWWYTGERPGTYSVRLEETTDEGCVFSTVESFEVRIRIPFAPNVFSPNGDALNETFRLLNAEGLSYELEIYNRFGRLVAHTGSEGWDGNTTNGKAASEGVYFFVARYGPERATLTGHVTLTR